MIHLKAIPTIVILNTDDEENCLHWFIFDIQFIQSLIHITISDHVLWDLNIVGADFIFTVWSPSSNHINIHHFIFFINFLDLANLWLPHLYPFLLHFGRLKEHEGHVVKTHGVNDLFFWFMISKAWWYLLLLTFFSSA